MTPLSRRLLMITVAIVSICVDLVTKYLAQTMLVVPEWCKEQLCSFPYWPRQIIGDILMFRYAENTGVAFSMPLTGDLRNLVTVLIIGGILIWWYRERKQTSTLVDWWLLLIISGAVGNGFERIFQWYVIDFIALKGFAVFNVADILISLWAIILILSAIYDARTEHSRGANRSE